MSKKGKVARDMAKERRKNVPLWERPLLHTNKVRRILIQLKVDPQTFEYEYVSDTSRNAKAVPTPVEVEVVQAYLSQKIDFRQAKGLLDIKTDGAFMNTVERVRKFNVSQAAKVAETSTSAELSTSV